MKLLVATAKTQGPLRSLRERRSAVDRPHGTTTALVAELPGFTLSDFAVALRSSLAAQGRPPERRAPAG
ncbi:hypothetical protein ACFWIW_41230 [Amycolatopsis sp. NPDC058340]|uniref:hypothetical protein n=1 Tax=Amycolatopsis sp. NPDC058340 TaxID=3346453 RepID=UPI003653E3CD